MYCLEGTLQTSSLSSTVEPGLTVVHVTSKKGQMRVLASTGLMALPTRRLKYHEGRLLGLLRKDGYLYLAFWAAASSDVPPRSVLKAGPSDHALRRERHLLESGYRLEVLELRSAKALDTAVFNRPGGPTAILPDLPPNETGGEGVLREQGGKVTMFGTAFVVENGKLKWASAPPTTRSATTREKPAGAR